MNSIFKELLESGRLELAFDYESDGKTIKAYSFSSDGWQMNESRFEEYNDVMKCYNVFRVDEEDYNTVRAVVRENTMRAMQNYKNDVDSAFYLLQQNIQLQDELDARIEFSIPIQKSFDLMSFTVIEEDENPLLYDHKYNKEKVKRWMRDLPAEKKRPYLQGMLQALPEVSMLLNSDSLTFIQQKVMLAAVRLQIHLHSSGTSGLSKETQQSLQSRLETLKHHSSYLTGLLRITTDMSPNGENEN